MMPMLLYLYTASLQQTQMQIPYLTVMGTLALMLVPIAGGMWIRHRSTATAKKVERVGAVSLETGVQNTPLAIAVILATFPDADQDALLKLPFLYAMTALCVGTVATLTYRRFPSA